MNFIVIIIGFIFAFSLSYHGFRKKSLSLSGSLAAFIVGFVHFLVCWPMAILLISFYYSSSKLTHFKEEEKNRLDEQNEQGARRNYVQVLANSLLATVLLLWFYFVDRIIGDFPNYYIHFFNNNTTTIDSATIYQSYIWCLVMAHYACANGDTWASEVGILSKSPPFLITNIFKPVPAGTNGGVSLLGLIASSAGGGFISLVFILTHLFTGDNTSNQKLNWMSLFYSQHLPTMIFGITCGLLGSLVDSLLGATLQATFFSKPRKCIVKKKEKNDEDDARNTVIIISGTDILSNEAVNFFSILITMIASLWIAPLIFNLFATA